VLAEKSLSVLKDAFDEKARTRAVEALAEVSTVVADAEHVQGQISAALAELSSYDSTWTDISLDEGIRRLRERITSDSKETAMLRGLYDKSDDVITSCKVALYSEITADHKWHPPEDNCPHVRCVALNKIESIRGG
jgi:hypothetical protein